MNSPAARLKGWFDKKSFHAKERSSHEIIPNTSLPVQILSLRNETEPYQESVVCIALAIVPVATLLANLLNSHRFPGGFPQSVEGKTRWAHLVL